MIQDAASSSGPNIGADMMAQDFDWLGSKPPERQPRCDFVTTFWMMRAPSSRVLTCAAYQTDTGIEPRTSYGADDIVATELFRGPTADEQVAEHHADTWRLNLMLKGFREVDQQGNDIADEIEDR